jgi:methylmalonyl-CoA mutase C-terminal domain/subunit
MNEKGLNDIILFGGGIIPDKDIKELYNLGIGKLFTPGASTNEIVNYIKSSVK